MEHERGWKNMEKGKQWRKTKEEQNGKANARFKGFSEQVLRITS